jgi:hypothetical protein
MQLTFFKVNHVDEEQIIRIAPNQTLQLLPLNWPEMAPEPGQIYSFAQKLVKTEKNLCTFCIHYPI